MRKLLALTILVFCVQCGGSGSGQAGAAKDPDLSALGLGGSCRFTLSDGADYGVVPYIIEFSSGGSNIIWFNCAGDPRVSDDSDAEVSVGIKVEDFEGIGTYDFGKNKSNGFFLVKDKSGVVFAVDPTVDSAGDCKAIFTSEYSFTFSCSNIPFSILRNDVGIIPKAPVSVSSGRFSFE